GAGQGRRRTSDCQSAESGEAGSTSSRPLSGARSLGGGAGTSGCNSPHCPPGGPPGCMGGGDASRAEDGETGPSAQPIGTPTFGIWDGGSFATTDGEDGTDGGNGGGGGAG